MSDNNEAHGCSFRAQEYIRVDEELNERAKDISRSAAALSHSAAPSAARDQKEFGLGEEGLAWIANQSSRPSCRRGSRGSVRR